MSIKTDVKPTIFREYIGGKSIPDFRDFPKIMINGDIKEFHFILAFATEAYDETTKKGTGNFNCSWKEQAFNANTIAELKRKFTNVKVVISIGGRGRAHAFNTDTKDVWLDNAVGTLEGIIDDINKQSSEFKLIDGIDVHYENIESTEVLFAESIGSLIDRLKNDKVIEVVSIAPSQNVQPHYRTLYRLYHRNIDLVDYRFYDQNESISTADEFVSLYQPLIGDYQVDKLLAGFSTEDETKITPQVFIDGCRILLQRQLLSGIFVWDAEDSSVTNENDPFQFEKIAQKLLVEFSTQDQ